MSTDQSYEPPIRSRVAPEVNPAGGGIVDDKQSADTSPGAGPNVGEHEHILASHTAGERYASHTDHNPTLKDKISGFAKVVEGKVFDNPADVEYGKAKAHGRV